MRSHDNTYKASLILSVLADVLLCAALIVSLFYYFHNGMPFSPHYIVGFSAFFILFAGFFVSLLIAVHTKKITALLVAVAFTVARFVCAIIVVIAWMSEYGGRSEDEQKPNGNETEDPYRWIANRKAYLLIFAGIYINIFIAQLVILNRYYSQANDEKRREETERNKADFY
ncbi:unnamed protein product [Caenorhabditis sp. 36 PRJEB53466]|nr:unnamed protein product [Caenorhabditis sp. 36 PRJEB53466]